MLKKIRGLWRHDGDEEPVTVSRRSFIFLSGVVLAGAALPENKVIATVTGASETYALPIYDAATGLPMQTLLVITDIDHVRGIVELSSMSAEEYVRYNPAPAVVDERGKTFDELPVGSAMTKQDVLLASALDQMRHPRGERWLMGSPHFAFVMPPDRIESWKRRLTEPRRPGGIAR